MIEAPPTKRAGPYWPALDGWRGLTIWFAISVHAGYFTAGGVLSLDTFFVLSGFLITGLLLREWMRHDEEHIDLLRFWARRARRLLPALFVVLAAVLVYAAFLASPLGLDRVRGDVLGSLFYVANWRFILSGQSYFSTFTAPSPVLHLWSLAVEEQFYLFWPPMVLGVLWIARRRFKARGAVAAVGIVALIGAIASAVLMASMYTQGGDPSRVYYGTDTRAQAMLMGAALAVIVTLHGPLRSRLGRSLLSVGATVGFVVVVLPWFATNATRVHDVFYGRFGLVAYSLAAAVVIWRLTQPSPGVLARGLQLRPVIWVGAISYEMYLWHWPLYLVLTPDRVGLEGLPLLALRLSAVVGLSAVTHFYVGEPVRRGVRLRSPRLARIATVGLVVALGVGVFAATLTTRPVLSGAVGEVADAGGPPVVPSAAATPSAGSASPAGPSITPVTPAPTLLPVKVLVVGDSQAATLAQGLDADPGAHGLSAQPGLAVWNRAILGCSIITVPTFLIDGDRADNHCGGADAWQRQWSSDVGVFTPDVVVVQAGAWDLFDVAASGNSVTRPGDAGWTVGYTRDVSTLFDTIGATGASIVAIRPPCFGTNDVVGGGPTPAWRLDQSRVAAVDGVWQQVAQAHGLELLDLDPTLCPGGHSDSSIRPDGAHYDDNGSNVVGTLVAKAVRSALARRPLNGLGVG